MAACLMLAAGLLFLLAACRQEAPPAQTAAPPSPTPLAAEPGEELPGGQSTIFDTSPNAFSQPIPGLEREQELLFFVGNSFFNQNWVTARDGLGPFFNARSCASGCGREPERRSSAGCLITP